MAYRIRENEPIGKGLERILEKELRSAIDQLTQTNTSDEAIHESRKSIKKARAILLLVPRGFRNKADRDIQQLRGAGRLLAPLRDLDAMVNTARDLCDRYADMQQKETCGAASSALDRHKTNIQTAERYRITLAVQALRIVRPAKRWQLKRTGFSTLVGTLKWDYKRAQLAMTGAKNSYSDSDFHRWRRRVKVLWYHLRLIEARALTVNRRVDELKQLETWLGEDHNLAVLRTQITANPVLQLDQSASALMIELSGRRQEELRRDALSLGARVFALTPREAFRALTEIWRLHPAHPPPTPG